MANIACFRVTSTSGSSSFPMFAGTSLTAQPITQYFHHAKADVNIETTDQWFLAVSSSYFQSAYVRNG